MSSVTSRVPCLNHHVLALLDRCSHLDHLKQIQAFLITIGHVNTQFYLFKLLRLCTLRLTNLDYARRIFDHHHSPNVYLYTAMVTAYAAHPEFSAAAFSLYRNMVRRGRPCPNHFIYPHVLRSCSDYLGSKLLHTQIVRSGFGDYPVVQTALVNSYSRFCSGIDSARKVFDEMNDRTVVSWTAMVSGYARFGQIENAVSLFDEMPERDVPSWNALIAGCTQNGLFSEAFSIFRRMLSSSDKGYSFENRPNPTTVACALSACGHTGTLQLGKGIHGYIYRNGLALDSYISNSLIDMYGKSGNLKEARLIFDMNPKRNLTSWNSMINCYALHAKTESSIHMFEEMTLCRGNVTPDYITFIGLLNACTHAGLVEKGRDYFESMTKDYGIQPRIEHYGCLIDLLGRAGRFEEALQVVKEMKVPPDEVVWGSLLNGCKIHGRADLAELAASKLVEFDPSNGGYGAMLANIYGELGKWDDSRRVRKELRDRDAYKIPGCSWVEINSQLHQFYSLDKSHPQTEKIYQVLDSLLGVS